MVPLDKPLSLLASIAVMRGRHAEADDLSRAASRFAAGRSDPSGTATGAVRDALARIRELGPDPTVAEALADLPHDFRRLVQHGTLELPDVAALHRLTGATSLGELLGALDATRATDARAADEIRRFRPAVERAHQARSRVPLGRAWGLLDPLIAAIRDACPEAERVEPTGSLRRFAATVGEIEVLVASPDPSRTTARLLTLPFVSAVLHAGPDRLVLRLERAELTIRIVRPDVYVARLVWLTGSAAHVASLRRRAASRQLTLTPDALTGSDGRPRPLASEDDLYAALGLAPIPPELREGDGEIEAAERRELPDLLRREHIRGDLHMHSDWSDGRDSTDRMLLEAEVLGYEYVAITDHSQSSSIARGLDVERLERQRDAVAAARERHPSISILHGSEVDILPDGTLDFPDAVLARLDVVLASLHDPADHSGARLTDRYISAMRHPLVQIVTHPTNRLVPHRGGYPLDEARLFEAAAATETILEIDGAPGHLDMDGAMARRAVSAGATVAVNGDCHRAELLGRHMLFAVATARRGWVIPACVANTRRLPQLRERLARKRRHG